MDEGSRTGAWQRKGLGWKPYWNPRDRDHLMISHLRRDLAGVAVPEERLWRIGPILDQGEEGACVGFAWRAWMSARPIASDPEGHIQAREIYLRATPGRVLGAGARDERHERQGRGEDHGLDGCIKIGRRTLSYLISQGYVSACAAAQVPQR